MDLDESGARTLTCACLIFNAATRLRVTKREGRSYIFGNWLPGSCFACQRAVTHRGCIQSGRCGDLEILMYLQVEAKSYLHHRNKRSGLAAT